MLHRFSLSCAAAALPHKASIPFLCAGFNISLEALCKHNSRAPLTSSSLPLPLPLFPLLLPCRSAAARARERERRRRRLDIRIFQSLQRYNPGWRPFYEYHEVQNDWLAASMVQSGTRADFEFFVVEWRNSARLVIWMHPMYARSLYMGVSCLALPYSALQCICEGIKKNSAPQKLKGCLRNEFKGEMEIQISISYTQYVKRAIVYIL